MGFWSIDNHITNRELHNIDFALLLIVFALVGAIFSFLNIHDADSNSGTFRDCANGDLLLPTWWCTYTHCIWVDFKVDFQVSELAEASAGRELHAVANVLHSTPWKLNSSVLSSRSENNDWTRCVEIYGNQWAITRHFKVPDRTEKYLSDCHYLLEVISVSKTIVEEIEIHAWADSEGVDFAAEKTTTFVRETLESSAIFSTFLNFNYFA